MDPLDEINAAIDGLCLIAARARESALDDLVDAVRAGEPHVLSADRREVAELALQYASWTRSLEGYRALRQRGARPVVVEK